MKNLFEHLLRNWNILHKIKSKTHVTKLYSLNINDETFQCPLWGLFVYFKANNVFIDGNQFTGWYEYCSGCLKMTGKYTA